MTACTDVCKHDIPVQKPSLFASRTVQASALSWVFAVGGLVAGTFPDQQTLGRLRAAALDKTGTITWGKPSVTASGV